MHQVRCSHTVAPKYDKCKFRNKLSTCCGIGHAALSTFKQYTLDDG